MSAATLKRTALYDEHVAQGARMVDFAGWSMPVSYSGILNEVRAVRHAAGVFDVSHMGSLFVSGPRAASMLDFLVPSPIATLEAFQARYTMFCNQGGGVLDDLIVYRLGAEEFLLIVNASRRDEDSDHLLKHAEEGIQLTDETLMRAILALQGPKTNEILQSLTDFNLGALKTFHAAQMDIAGESALVARTGYTGEDGFEIMTSAASAPHIWRALFEKGRSEGLLPCGLGARDVLRLEAGLPLYGHELNEETNPYEAGFGWVVKLDKGDFLGRDALALAHEQGPRRRLRGLKVEGKAIPRTDQPVAENGRQVGIVTSGTFSPTLGQPIAMAYLDKDTGDSVEMNIRGTDVPASVVSLPFYHRSK